jgi:hypothetical protein
MTAFFTLSPVLPSVPPVPQLSRAFNKFTDPSETLQRPSGSLQIFL